MQESKKKVKKRERNDGVTAAMEKEDSKKIK